MSRFRSRCIGFAAIVFLIISTCLSPALAAEEIDSYHVAIDVGENNVYHVTEKIQMTFAPDEGSHGMYWTMDLQPHVYFMENGEYYERDYHVLLENLDVIGDPYETEMDDGTLYVRVGDPDVYVDGQTKTYEITYDYDAGDDGFADFDMFYYGIIGNNWDEPINDVTFEIRMPKEFDTSKLGFSVGYTGNSGYNEERLNYTVNDNIITGEIIGQLDAGEGIWIRVPLPAGYYTNVRKNAPGANYITWISLGLATAACIAFLLMRQRKKPVVTVEFHPPEGLTSADVGYVIDGITEDRDVISLLMYWASKGYLKIVEIAPDDKQLKKEEAAKAKARQKNRKLPIPTRDLLLVRLSDLPETAQSYEQLMFDALFRKGDRIRVSELNGKFYTTVNDTKKRIDNRFTTTGQRVFRPANKMATDACCCLSAIPLTLLGAFATYYRTYEFGASIVVGVFLFISVYLVAVAWNSIMKRWLSEKASSRRGTVIVFAVIAGLLCVLDVGAAWPFFGGMGIICAVCSLFIMLIAPLFRARTELGLKWTGHILGLRRFIERAEKDRLEQLVAGNPEYFYNILPFAYVLGITDIWASRFEGIALPPPSWYGGMDSGSFTTAYFTSALLQDMHRATTSLATPPASGGGSSGGSGSSGGGFSGGGFGGSGGGRW